MAVYVYKCETCGGCSELDFPMGEAPERLLDPFGSGHRFKRVYTAPAIQFRGSGWGGKSSA